MSEGYSDCLNDWQIDILIDWKVDILIDWQVDILIDWRVDILVDWQVDILIDWQVDILIDWQVDILVDTQVDILIDWQLTFWLTDRLTFWLTDRLTFCLTDRLTFCLNNWLKDPLYDSYWSSRKVTDYLISGPNDWQTVRLVSHSYMARYSFAWQTDRLTMWNWQPDLLNFECSLDWWVHLTNNWLAKENITWNPTLIYCIMDRSMTWTANRFRFFYKSKPGTDRHCKAFRETRDLTLMKIQLAPTDWLHIDDWQTDRQADRQTDRQTDRKTERHTVSSVVKSKSRQFASELKEMVRYIADCLIYSNLDLWIPQLVESKMQTALNYLRWGHSEWCTFPAFMLVYNSVSLFVA